MKRFSLLLCLLLSGISFFFGSERIQAAEKSSVSIEEIPLNEQFLHYIRHRFDDNRTKDVMPKSLSEWKTNRKNVYETLANHVGLLREKQCELDPKKMGEIKRDGYRIEKLLLKTFPDIQATAFAYVPDGEGPFPAVLCVHGHWPRGKQDPTVQSRCIGLAKLGFFVLAVDAFGAGERGLGKALGEYHGASVGATLFPSGLLLPGLQLYENSRFVDYLQTRKEVLPEKIGVTGASGGGNQTMYAGAMEKRFKAVVPVCSVGTYRSYLGAACCYCEMYPGMMASTEEWALLSMTAPRALMVVNATQDSIQFSPGEAKKSIKNSKPIFQFYSKEKNLKHVIFESKHDYNKEMREAMYGWMTLHLKGEGAGDPIPEPEHEPLDPEKMRCFPDESRPDSFTNLIQFAEKQSRKLVDQKNQEWNESRWKTQRTELKEALKLKLNSHYSPNRFSSLSTEMESENKIKITVSPEPGIQIEANLHKGKNNKLAILINLEDQPGDELIKTSASLVQNGWNVLEPELRSTKQRKVIRDRIKNSVDHNSVEWSLWNGIPLLGQWVTDIQALIDVAEFLEKKSFQEIVLIGDRSGGMVAVASGIMDQRVSRVASLNMLSSFVPNAPFEHDRLGIIVPGILKEVGDVSHLCGLLAPRKLLISGGHLADGKRLDSVSLKHEYKFAKNAYDWLEASDQFKVNANENATEKETGEIYDWIAED